MYIRCHNFLLHIGVSRFVNVSKWLGFVVSLIVTLGHTFEHVFLGKVGDLVYCSYFTELNTELAEAKYFDYIASMSCFVSNLVELLLFIIIIYELSMTAQKQQEGSLSRPAAIVIQYCSINCP